MRAAFKNIKCAWTQTKKLQNSLLDGERVRMRRLLLASFFVSISRQRRITHWINLEEKAQNWNTTFFRSGRLIQFVIFLCLKMHTKIEASCRRHISTLLLSNKDFCNFIYIYKVVDILSVWKLHFLDHMKSHYILGTGRAEKPNQDHLKERGKNFYIRV